jgi:hypothetical protein
MRNVKREPAMTNPWTNLTAASLDDFEQIAAAASGALNGERRSFTAARQDRAASFTQCWSEFHLAVGP